MPKTDIRRFPTRLVALRAAAGCPLAHLWMERDPERTSPEGK